jgi:hypothetical protein
MYMFISYKDRRLLMKRSSSPGPLTLEGIWYSLASRLCGPQNRSEQREGKYNIFLNETRNPTPLGRASYQNVVFSSYVYLQFRTMDKDHRPSDSERYVTSSEFLDSTSVLQLRNSPSRKISC